MAYARSDLSLAAECQREAAVAAERAHAEELAILARSRGAFIAYDAGDIMLAERQISDLRERADAFPKIAGTIRGYLGNLARARRRFSDAREFYRQAQELSRTENPIMHAIFVMDEAVIDLLEGHANMASRHLSLARERMPSPGDWLGNFLLLHYTSLLHSIHGTNAQREEACARLGVEPRDRARRRRALKAEATLLAPAIANYLDEGVRLSVRARENKSEADRRSLLEEFRALRDRCPANEHARLTLAIVRPLLSERPADETLVVARDARSFRVGDAVEADLSSKGGPRKILLALTNARLQRPGEQVSFAALIEAGWPDERIGERAARNRAHVALATLRKLGLEAVLVRRGEGYLIDPLTKVSLVD